MTSPASRPAQPGAARLSAAPAGSTSPPPASTGAARHVLLLRIFVDAALPPLSSGTRARPCLRRVRRCPGGRRGASAAMDLPATGACDLGEHDVRDGGDCSGFKEELGRARNPGRRRGAAAAASRKELVAGSPGHWRLVLGLMVASLRRTAHARTRVGEVDGARRVVEPTHAPASEPWFKICSNMSTRGSILRLSRQGSPALDDCDLPELLQCCCHEPAVRDMFYTENYERLCFLKCNVTKGCTLSIQYVCYYCMQGCTLSIREDLHNNYADEMVNYCTTA